MTHPAPQPSDHTLPQQSTSPDATTQQAPAGRRERPRRFTDWVQQLCTQDPGARTALRSGLRKDLDQVPRMHRFVAPWLPDSQLPADTERAYYAIAAMIAAQPRAAPIDPPTDEHPKGDGRRERSWGTSLGTAFALAAVEGPGREKVMRESTAEARLNLLTRQSVTGLHRHLPAAVGYLRGLDVAVDFAQLLDDLSNWRRHSGRIKRRWLQDYYRLRDRQRDEQADQDDAGEQADHSDTVPPGK